MFKEIDKPEDSITIEEIQDMNHDVFYRFMCDVLGVTYHIDKNELIRMFNEKINQKK